MILISIEMKNFKQYRDQAIEFREGLVGIIGPNGAGKSTIFDAMLLALYGELPSNKEHIRSSSAGEKETVSVSLEFEAGGKRYRVVREYRGKNLTAHGRLYGHSDDPISSGARETTVEVSKILGMDADAFTRSIFAGQKELGAISGSRGAERRELVRRMIGMEELDAIQKMVRADYRRAEDELAGMERMLLSSEEMAEKTGRVAELKEIIKGMEDEAAKLADKLSESQKAYDRAKKDFAVQQGLYRKYTDANELLIKASKDTEFGRKTLASTAERLKELEELKKELESMGPVLEEYVKTKKQKEQMDALYTAFRERSRLISQRDVHRGELEKINREARDNRAAFDKLCDVEKELAAAQEELDQNSLLIKGAEASSVELKLREAKIRQIVQDRQESMEKINAAGRDSNCPTCLRPLRDAYEDTLARLKADIELYEMGELEKLRTELKKAEAEPVRLREEKKKIESGHKLAHKRAMERENLEKNFMLISKRINEKSVMIKELEEELRSLEKIDYDAELHGKVKEALVKLEEVHGRSLELSGKVKEIPSLKAEMDSLRKSIARMESEERARGEELKLVPYSEKAYREAEKAQTTEESKRDQARDEFEKAKTTMSQSKQELTAVEKELEEDRARRLRIEKSRAAATALKKLEAHFDSFKTAALERVRPSISKHAGELFQQCTRGRYESIRVDENFDFFILDDGAYYPINRFSGGEVDLANLCLRVAISRVISEMSGAGGTGFMGFDEIFGSQDSERRAEILAAFQHLRERYRQIFIVSHIDEIKEEFPAILEVRRDAGGSRVGWLAG